MIDQHDKVETNFGLEELFRAVGLDTTAVVWVKHSTCDYKDNITGDHCTYGM